MSRLDIQSTVVIAVATACALGVGLSLNHAGQRGEAQAAVPVVTPVVTAARPQTPSPAKGSNAQVLKAADGHYWAEATIDGRAVRVLVDTGASVVALTREDAARLGLRLTPDDFDGTVHTASGPTPAAAVTLSSVSVAGARVDNVEAIVVQQGLKQSLLGMSFLGRLSAFEATPVGLTLRP